MQDPYRTPNTRLDLSGVPAPRSSLVAVLLGGLLVDFVGTIAVSVLLALGISVGLAAWGYTQAEVMRSLESEAYVYLANGLGVSMTVAGGYVAARWARTREVWHGGLSGALSLVLGLPFFLVPERADPLWLNLVLLVLQIPFAMLGGRLARRRPGGTPG